MQDDTKAIAYHGSRNVRFITLHSTIIQSQYEPHYNKTAITAKADHYYNSIIIITRLYYYSNVLLRIMYGSTIHYRLVFVTLHLLSSR